MDAVACEPQFLDHLAPVWRLLPPQHRGRLLVATELAARARALGLDAEPIDVVAIRRSSRPPDANPGPGPIAFVTSIGDTKVGRRLGYRRFVFMEHGAGQTYAGDRDLIAQRHPSYAGGLDREDTGLVLVPNEYAAAAWRRHYPTLPIVVVGCPKLEDLPAREPGPGPVVALTWHWPGFVTPEADTALGHYMRAIPELARRFRVICTAHPKADWPERVQRYCRARWGGIEFVPAFEDVCRRADLLVFDNTSAGFEFAATGRPVLVLNRPQYRREVVHGGRFWDWATVGIQVDEPDQLIAGVARALEDPPEVRAERERVVDLIYPVRTGAARRAAAAIVDWLTLPATLPPDGELRDPGHEQRRVLAHGAQPVAPR